MTLKRMLGLDTRAERYAYALDAEIGYVSAQKVPERWVPTTCGYCSVGCGMFIGVPNSSPPRRATMSVIRKHSDKRRLN